MEKTYFLNVISKMLYKIVHRDEPTPEGYQGLNPPEIKFVVFVTGWKNVGIISRVLKTEKVRFHTISKGKGTANSEILNLLGIGDDSKAIILCLEQAPMIPVLFKEVKRKLGFNTPGQGIAFTIPLTAINHPLLLVFKESMLKNDRIALPRNYGGRYMTKEYTHDLILAVINHGHSDEFMNTARAAGARGGTVFQARGQTGEGMIKRFGISIQDEKEIILIMCNRETKVPIMQAVSSAHGLNSKAQGIVFALPVEDVLGIDPDFGID